MDFLESARHEHWDNHTPPVCLGTLWSWEYGTLAPWVHGNLGPWEIGNLGVIPSTLDRVLGWFTYKIRLFWQILWKKNFSLFQRFIEHDYFWFIVQLNILENGWKSLNSHWITFFKYDSIIQMDIFYSRFCYPPLFRNYFGTTFYVHITARYKQYYS